MGDPAKNSFQLDTLHNSDCISGMQEITEGSVDLAFADPPFNIGYKYDVYEDRMKAEEYLAWSKQWGQALVRTLKPDGTFWLAIGDDFAAELKLMFQRELGLVCRSWVIWYYTFGVHCKYKFSRSHTHLFHFVKDPKRFTFNTQDLRVPSARQLVYNDLRADSRGRIPDDTWILRPQDAPDSFTEAEDTWYVPRVCGTFKERAGWHGCQMPEQILGRIIRTCSNKGETVLDPFGGSGTTLVSAKKLERKFIGFELSKNYAEQIRKRLASATPGDALSGTETSAIVAPSTPARPKTPAPRKMPSKVGESGVIKRPGQSDLDRGIVDAFLATRQGFPVDRVIADPDINGPFLAKCVGLGLPGRAFDWNQRLMNLRKIGHFKGLPRSLRTVLPTEERDFDRYKFACEIAIQRFEQDNDLTLDHILCDPDLAGGFDRYVLTMLPDSPSSLKIRWFAIRIRKSVSSIRSSSANLATLVSMPRDGENPFGLAPSQIPSERGMYWLSGHQQHLYVGETMNLRDRFEVQFGHKKFNFWDTAPEHLHFSFKAVGTTTPLPQNQSRWISQWQPIGNYLELATKL
jgi:site-specific DNA-methyltransferase (adenine-specific)